MDNKQNNALKGYTLHEHIDGGGFGDVFRAVQTTIDREVAVKIIKPAVANKPDYIRRFEAEAQLIARLEHPHITPLIDYWRDLSGAYLVMRYLKGGSLRDALRKSGAFEFTSISSILDDIGPALDFAHRQQVIHRDIKPGNILLDEDGNTYLADFGIAKDLTIPDGATSPDAVVGSLDYISPEQARSEPVTPSTDIYSLGVVLYELVTGEHPFKEAAPIERLYRHINDPLPDIEGLDDEKRNEVNEIIQRATQKDPAKRYPDVLELSLAFREAIGRDDTQEDIKVIEQLTMREHEVLQLLAEGITNREIAENLFIEPSSVRWHLRNIYKKLGVRGRVQAIVRARELDLIETERVALAMQPDNPTVLARSISLPEPENPYKGLHAFQTADARDFFGRNELIEKHLGLMADAEIDARFLAIVGPSGSGKSSLVKAGLIPAIRRGKLHGSDKWFIVDMLPGQYPLDELEIALLKVAANQAPNLREQLQRDERGLVRAAELILPKDDTQLLVVIDQFEEVFTQVENEDLRQQFLDIIRVAVQDKRSRVRVVVTMRADYYDRPLHYPQFGEMLRNRMDTILPLSAKGLERAISAPAERVGVTFEAGLVAQIVSEMNYQAGALPLLQYALTELFDRRDGRLLTHEAYTAIGGAVGALANRADEIYLNMTLESQQLAHQIFLRLVTLGEGAEDTRRRTPLAELLSIADDADLIEEVIDTFASYRLLALDHDDKSRQPTVEVAHEAILREWERLRAWLNDSRDDIRQERIVATAADDWNSNKRDQAYLLRGARLDQAESWLGTTELALTPIEHQFVKESIKQRHLETQEREGQRNIRRILVATVMAVLFLGIGVSFTLFLTTQQALNTSEQIRLSSHAQNVLNSGASGELPALLALSSLERGYSTEADAALLESLDRGFPVREFTGHTDFISWMDISLDGRLLLTVGGEGIVIIWNIQTGEEIQRISGQFSDFWIAEFAPDGNTIVTGSINGRVRIWDVNSGSLMQELADYSYQVWGARFSHDGQTIAVSGSENVVLIDVQTGEEIRQVVGRETTSMGIGFSADGQYICSGGLDGNNHIWEVSTGIQLRVFEGHTGFTACESFSPDGQHVLTAGEDSVVIMWELASGRQILNLDEHVATAGYAEFSQDGQYIVSSDFGGNAYLWDSVTGQQLNQFRGHTGAVQTAIMSPDMKYIITIGDDSKVLLWDAFGSIEPRIFSIPILPHTTQARFVDYDPTTGTLLRVLTAGQVYSWDVNGAGDETLLFNIGFNTSAVMSNDKQFIVAGYENGEVRIWDIKSGSAIHRFEAHTGAVQAIALSANGGFITTSGMDNTLRLWDMTTGTELRQFAGTTTGIRVIAYSVDGQIIAISGDDGILRLWDVSSGSEISQLTGHQGAILALQFSPDGRSIVSASADNTAILWDVNSGEMLQSFIGHTNQVTAVAFSDDSSRVMTGSFDRTARLWDTTTGEEIRYLTGHTTSVSAVSFDPNSQYVFTTDNSNSFMWLAELEDVIELACSRLPRDFHDDERTLYNITNEKPTCSQGFVDTTSAELNWTPYPTRPKPNWTPIPPEPVYVEEFVFLGDVDNIECCSMPPFVYAQEGNQEVIGITEIKNMTLNSPVFSAAQPIDIGSSPPFAVGPYPMGQSLGFTLHDWLMAKGTGTYTERNNRAHLELAFEHLVPNGLYTLWCVEMTNIPQFNIIAERPCGAPDGSENIFTVTDDGHADFSIEIDAFPSRTQERYFGIAIAYHSDGMTHGTSAGEHGMNAHVQLFYDFIPGN